MRRVVLVDVHRGIDHSRITDAGAPRTSIGRMRRHVGDDVLRTAVGGYRLVADVDAAHAELLPFVEQGVESVTTGAMAFRIAHAIVCCEVGRPEVAADLLHATMRGEVEPTTDDFGWQYHRATTLVALAQDRFRADGRLDDEGMAWLAAAEDLCDAHGIVGWAKRAARLRARVPA